MTVSVIIITLNRPDYVYRCLECLFAQEHKPDQIIVVDSSEDDRTRKVVAKYPNVLYLRNEKGYGHMTHSRNIGLQHAIGDIIAFLDDDAYAHPEWLTNLLATYTDPSIGGVGGRTLNNQPGEEILGVNKIGQLSSNGAVLGYFAADPGRVIEVDHTIGANMSFRREVLAQLGGFRESYPGISGLREDTDICLRVKRLGYRILFNPAALVDHIGAPQGKGSRFDFRYIFCTERNHCTLLIMNFGFFAPIVWRYFGTSFLKIILGLGGRIVVAFVRVGSAILGTFWGIVVGIAWRLRSKGDPVRHDVEGVKIRDTLNRHSGKAKSEK